VFWVSGSGFGVYGFGFGFMISGLGFRVSVLVSVYSLGFGVRVWGWVSG
jgi:hypothetical protein